MEALMERINEAANYQLRRDAEWIEERLLAGENRIEYISASGHHVVIEVPRWRDHPVQRLRIEWRRFRFDE